MKHKVERELPATCVVSTAMENSKGYHAVIHLSDISWVGCVDYDSFRRSSGDGVRMLCRTRYIKSHVPQVTYEHVTISFGPQ